ncbi:hypothetical protein C1N60_23260 (plasmid) [Pantoea sp. SGAir0184]|nr:hypothetical protein [Enterobacter roggenkampii]
MISAIDFKKSLCLAVKHGLVVPGAFAVTLTLAVGPDRIYDCLTDLDTAILYESIEKSLHKTNINDTSLNQEVINLNVGKVINQLPANISGSANVIIGKGEYSVPVDLSPELHNRTLTTAAVRQTRLNVLLDMSNDPALPRNALKSVLVGFASHRNSLKALVSDVLLLSWMLSATCSFAIDSVFQNRRENKSK